MHDIDDSKRTRRFGLPLSWPVFLCAVVGLAAGSAYGVLRTPEYAATSYVVAVSERTIGAATVPGFAQAYARIATGDTALASIQHRVGIDAGKLRHQVRAEAAPDSPVIAVTGESKSPAEAADIANAVADALTLSSGQTARNTGMRLQPFGKAIAPAAPSSADARITAAVGLCTGVLTGFLWMLALPRRRATKQLLTTLAMLAQQEGSGRHRSPEGDRDRDLTPWQGKSPAEALSRDPWH
ncbi:lipopolysaccharide biosynthesis protein [Streptomyces goshikiensis]|uniref:lipopolysaccharide biosynthesis protein n=1 Tax=Streptomyces goshikiensis TaxID=1942 RepID=UPI00369A03CC